MSTDQPHDPNAATPQSNWQPPHVPAPPVPEPKRKNWFARHKILTALLVLVLIGIVGSAVSGSGGDRSAGSTTPAPADGDRRNDTGDGKQENDTPALAKVGQKVRDGQFEFTVTAVKKGVASVGDQSLGQKAQGQYVLVGVTVTNIGEKAQLLADSSQKLRDAQGREFSSDTAAAIYIKGNDVFLNEINPGNSVKGTLVFDMPKGASPVSIELHDSPFSEGVTVALG